MIVKELIEKLKLCDLNKEIYFESYGEMILMDIHDVKPNGEHFINKKKIVIIEGDWKWNYRLIQLQT